VGWAAVNSFGWASYPISGMFSRRFALARQRLDLQLTSDDELSCARTLISESSRVIDTLPSVLVRSDHLPPRTPCSPSKRWHTATDHVAQ